MQSLVINLMNSRKVVMKPGKDVITKYVLDNLLKKHQRKLVGSSN